MGRKHCSVSFLAAITLLGIVLSGCDGQESVRWWSKVPGYGHYWWQRGQPKSPAELYTQMGEKLQSSVEQYKNARPDIAAAAADIRGALNAAYGALDTGSDAAAIAANLTKVEDSWMGLEGKLSVGSRAAYGELAGELRAFTEKLHNGQDPKDEAFRESLRLYSARVYSFLANEITVPAPVVL